MIGIRSVTYQMPRQYDQNDLDAVWKISREWSASFANIKTQRLNFTPYKHAINMKALANISNLCNVSEIRWFNIPVDPFQTEDRESLFQFAEEVLQTYGRSFVNVIAFEGGRMDFDILKRSAELIKATANLSYHGMDNFRLGLSVNPGTDGPFFPFTFSGGNFGFSIALELVQEINAIIDANNTVGVVELREIILRELRCQIESIESQAQRISQKYKLRFLGFDFSLAPVISADGSIIPIIQHLGAYNFGKTGTLFATAYLTDMLKQLASDYLSVGFSGVMYSLLEDLELCKINSLRGISLDDLIKVSTMCGCGVDMVPLPCDLSVRELLTIFIEVYTISTRLHKPLGIRVLPIPNTHHNQIAYTDLNDDADFIANTRVLNPDINILNFYNRKFHFLQSRGKF